MASIDHLHQESLTAESQGPLRYALCAVPCELSGRGWHGITTQEPRPRPMKETLHSRHHSTVLSRLGASRKEIFLNLHTHAVYSTIQLLYNKKSTEGAPIPNIGRGTETEPKTTMHFLTAAIRTLPYTSGLQA